uniref:Putative endochitinase 2 n=1 Tax=Tachinaephagus zealandicus TaxID=543383 RepID=A0A0U3SJ89_9HYME|nr:putative endochitinase 2 [Tachinaephagus zealandicus]
MGIGNSRRSSSSEESEDEAVIEESEFNRAVRACGYSVPRSAVYRHLAALTSDFTRAEMAMFVAQTIHESGGFRYIEEQDPESEYRDNDALPGRSYHGRGYIQLTWSENYKRCSRELGMGDDLLRNPDKVTGTVNLAMKVSVWYWKKFVRPEHKRRTNCFGVTTNAINGAIECRGYNKAARSRYTKYKKVADAMGIRNIASERGCYN